MSTTTAPVQKGARIGALDTLRGIALLGILMMNITAFGQLYQAYANPMADGGATGANLWSFIVINVGFEGTMRGIFSLLFGAGVVLMTGRIDAGGDPASAAEIHFRRMLWMMLFGVIHWWLLLWAGEILFQYSIAGLIIFSFRKLPPLKLAAIGGALLLGAMAMTTIRTNHKIEVHDQAVAAQQVKAAGGTLSAKQSAAIAEWRGINNSYWPDAASIAEQKAWHSGSWWQAVKGQMDESYADQWTSLPRRLAFDTIPFMLIGMAMLKAGILSGRKSKRTYAAMALGGYAIGIPLGIYELNLMLAGKFATLSIGQAGLTYQISRLAMVIGHLGLALLVIRLGLFTGLQRALAAVGQMALTNYISQTLICTALFYGFGFGVFSAFDRHELYYIVFAIWVLQLVWSPLWLSRFRFGPMEWLWRSLTYWRPQPMRIAGPRPTDGTAVSGPAAAGA